MRFPVYGEKSDTPRGKPPRYGIWFGKCCSPAPCFLRVQREDDSRFVPRNGASNSEDTMICRGASPLHSEWGESCDLVPQGVSSFVQVAIETRVSLETSPRDN